VGSRYKSKVPLLGGMDGEYSDYCKIDGLRMRGMVARVVV